MTKEEDMAKQKVRVLWTEGKQFIGTDSGKHSIVISSHDEANDTGIRPSDLLLLGLASCTGYDVVNILNKKRVDLQKLDIKVAPLQDDDPPWTFREIHLTFRVKGSDLTEKAIDQAIKLSLEKYCSVASTISGKAKITYDFIVEE
jgi:putative redox protein